MAAGVAYCMRCWAVGTCCAMAAAYMVGMLGLESNSSVIYTAEVRLSDAKQLISNRLLHIQVLGASIWVFRVPYQPQASSATWRKAEKQMPITAVPWTTAWLPILALYTPVHIFSFIVALSFAVLPVNFAGAFWIGFFVLYYATTLQNQPHHTGRFAWLGSQHLADAQSACK